MLTPTSTYALIAMSTMVRNYNQLPMTARELAELGADIVKVVYTGSIMTMPGLPKQPAALSIDVDAQGNISGLF